MVVIPYIMWIRRKYFFHVVFKLSNPCNPLLFVKNRTWLCFRYADILSFLWLLQNISKIMALWLTSRNFSILSIQLHVYPWAMLTIWEFRYFDIQFQGPFDEAILFTNHIITMKMDRMHKNNDSKWQWRQEVELCDWKHLSFLDVILHGSQMKYVLMEYRLLPASAYGSSITTGKWASWDSPSISPPPK